MALSDLPELPAAELVNPVEVVRGRWDRFRSQLVILFGDFLAIAVAMLLSASHPISYESISAALLILNMVLWGLYQTRMSLHILDDLPRVLAASVTAGALGAAVFALLNRAALSATDQFFMATLVIAVVLARTASYWFVRWRRRHGQLSQRTVILGAGKVARDLGIYLTEDRSYGCDLVGFVDSSPALAADDPSGAPARSVGTDVEHHPGRTRRPAAHRLPVDPRVRTGPDHPDLRPRGCGHLHRSAPVRDDRPLHRQRRDRRHPVASAAPRPVPIAHVVAEATDGHPGRRWRRWSCCHRCWPCSRS